MWNWRVNSLFAAQDSGLNCWYQYWSPIWLDTEPRSRPHNDVCCLGSVPVLAIRPFDTFLSEARLKIAEIPPPVVLGSQHIVHVCGRAVYLHIVTAHLEQDRITHSYQNPRKYYQHTSAARLAAAHMQMHQLSPGFGPSHTLRLQFHLAWPVMSQKLTAPEVPGLGHLTSSQLWLSSTSLAHTRCVLSWIHL